MEHKKNRKVRDPVHIKREPGPRTFSVNMRVGHVNVSTRSLLICKPDLVDEVGAGGTTGLHNV